ncbi:MAG: hypothetical protein AB1351_02915, partial [Thermoproteota archaeon]
AFTIKTSLGEGFTDILSAVSTGETDDFERYPIPPTQAKFVRIVVNFNVTEKAAINELVIYGVA